MFRLPDSLTSENVICYSLKLLERLNQAILDVIDPEKTNKSPLSERYFDKRSTT
jgi:hypothetical protein